MDTQSLHIDYDELDRMANVLDQKQADLALHAHQILNLAQQVTAPGVWSGIGAKAFWLVAAQFVRVLQTVVADMQAGRDSLRNYARQMREEEHRLQEEARARLLAMQAAARGTKTR